MQLSTLVATQEPLCGSECQQHSYGVADIYFDFLLGRTRLTLHKKVILKKSKPEGSLDGYAGYKGSSTEVF